MPYLCPACKSELKWGGSLSYQTSIEHILNPDYESPARSFYYCENTKCDAAANAPIAVRRRLVLCEKTMKTVPNDVCVFWDVDGELYGRAKGIKFIDNNDGPFGSITRRLRIEINKRDENFTFFTGLGIKLNIVYSYTADEDGNILKKQKHLEVLIKSSDLNGDYRHFINPVSEIIYLHYRFKRNIKEFRQSGAVLNSIELEQLFRPTVYMNCRSFPEVVYSYYLRAFYPLLRLKLRREKK